MNQQQQQAIEYLREENKVLREQLGGRRLRFTDEQRRRLAVKAKGLTGASDRITGPSTPAMRSASPRTNQLRSRGELLLEMRTTPTASDVAAGRH